MFKVGDHVEVIADDDPLFGYIGKIVDIYPEVNFRPIRVVLGKDMGEGLVALWFHTFELRKVESA